MAVIERTCDRCARFAEDCTVIEDAYICGGCRAEIAAEEAEVEALRRQLRGAVEALEAIREALTVNGRPVSVRAERAVTIIDATLTTTGGQ
jgi:hypothetical protein